ncbi:hypothetical protein JCM10212_001955 [Sporobolomyces blumeae]
MNGAELGDLGLASGADGRDPWQTRAAAARSDVEPEVDPPRGQRRRRIDSGEPRESLEGDLGHSRDDSLSDISPIEAAIAARPPRPDHIDLPLPLLELPAPALDVASQETLPKSSLSPPWRAPSTTSPASPTSPRLRTHFDLTNSPPPHVAPLPSTSIALKPILQHGPSAVTTTRESDIAESIRREGAGSPSFHSDDEVPQPGPRHRHRRDKRTPHPLYTPAPSKHRRRRRRRTESVASGRTGRSSRSARSKVKHALRKVRRRTRRGSHSSMSSTSSSSSSSSSSSTTSGSSRSSTAGSSRSSSTWAGWKFWRNSSSGSSSTGDSSSSDDEWDPPTPHFTLLTPHLTRPTLAYPSHLFSGSTMPSRRNSFNVLRDGARGFAPSAGQGPFSPPLDFGAAQPGSSVPVFDLLNATTLPPTLERLQAFWLERRQEDGVGGDLGVGSGGPTESTNASYFPPAATFGDPTNNVGTSASTPATPAFTPGVAGGPSIVRRLRGEMRAARAEEKRFGKNRAMENGPAWWLDVMCPTVADMRELRKHLPLHPLTIEDILHQETREKMESFAALGYYFIVFRALDESYFKYTSADSSSGKGSDSSSVPGPSTARRGRVDIVEGVGGKEGVEGVGVGAINLYLVVFGDGILSFHFEPVDQHIERVQGKLQDFGISRNFSSHWIAYSLMDSVVDSFFPLIDFIESESNEISTFLSDPLTHIPSRSMGRKKKKRATNPPATTSNGVGQTFTDEIVGIAVETPSTDRQKELDLDLSSTRFSAIKVSTRLRRRPTGDSNSSYSRFVPSLRLPAAVLRILPPSFAIRAHTDRIVEKTMLADDQGIEMYPIGGETAIDMSRLTGASYRPKGETGAPPAPSSTGRDTRFDNKVMLTRITDMRKLVTGLSRLLAPKTDVVRGLRKRTMEHNLGMFKNDAKHDIAVYIGDLFDHTLAMYQSLAYYDAILSHDHPTYQGMLRMRLNGTKLSLTKNVVRLTIVTLTFLPLSTVTGLFSENFPVPRNGDRENHLRADGSRSPFNWFGIVICIVFTVMCVMWALIWLIFKTSRRKFKRRGHIIS